MMDEPRDRIGEDGHLADPETPDDIGDDPGPDRGSETGAAGISGTGTTDFRPGHAEPTAARDRILGTEDADEST